MPNSMTMNHVLGANNLSPLNMDRGLMSGSEQLRCGTRRTQKSYSITDVLTPRSIAICWTSLVMIRGYEADLLEVRAAFLEACGVRTDSLKGWNPTIKAPSSRPK